MIIKNKMSLSIVCLLATSSIMQACLNTISNNTQHTYKIVEITEKNHEIKKAIFLPNEYLNDEHKAHTIKPGQECAFGGNYVPTFAIFKQDPKDDRWHNLLIVKQTRCGPRGPENKYLLLTDLLRRELPGDYNNVYKFTLRKEANEILDESTNTEALTSIENQYQVILNLLDDLTQKIQEVMSQVMSHQPRADNNIHDNNTHSDKNNAVPNASDQENEPTIGETKDGASCSACKLPAA